MSHVSEKRIAKLVKYIKDDRPKKLKAYAKKYEIDLPTVVLSCGRNLLHCAAKHGHSSSVISYLIEHGVSVHQVDSKGSRPVHIALKRTLKSSTKLAINLYSDIVKPLLSCTKDIPDPNSPTHRLQTEFNERVKEEWSSYHSGWDSSDQAPGGHPSSEDDWAERLASEFEAESTEFYGRYCNSYDYTQESQAESWDDWADRIRRERDRLHSHKNSFQTQGSQKRRHHSPADSGTRHKIPKAKPGINTKEEIHKVRARQDKDKLRKRYEERFQAALVYSGEEKLGYRDIPWPCRGSLDSMMEVLFGDKDHWDVSSLKKYIREQQLRWHPDKFMQKFANRIDPESVDKVMERVTEISQALNKKAEAI